MTERTAFHRLEDGSLAVYQKADDILDYAVGVSELLGDTDTILSSVWAAETVIVSAPEESGSTVSAFVAGTSGSVTNIVTTVGGRRKRTDFAVLPEA